MFAFTKLLLTTLFAAATNLTVAPAVAGVPIDSASSGVDYFPSEAAQLTGDVLANLTALKLTNASLFEFGDASGGRSPAIRGRSHGRRSDANCPACKAFPGNPGWPSAVEWFILDLLLGGALIKAVPVAAPCFSDWPQYDPAKCTEITANWEMPPFQ